MSVTKDHAEKIVRKLSKKLVTSEEPSGAHRMVYIEYEGVIIAEFGIRHGSNRNQGHGHIPRALFINRHNTLRLAQCTMETDEWLKELRRLGKLPGGSGGNGGDDDEEDKDDEPGGPADEPGPDEEGWTAPPE